MFIVSVITNLQHDDLFSSNPSLCVQNDWTPCGRTSRRNLKFTTESSSVVNIHGIGGKDVLKTEPPVSRVRVEGECEGRGREWGEG